MTTVVSRDGTEIAWWTTGDGPPLLLVHGTSGVHDASPRCSRSWNRTERSTPWTGAVRGASGDVPDYDLEREFEDVAAVVDAIAEGSGSPVDVYGHSTAGSAPSARRC